MIFHTSSALIQDHRKSGSMSFCSIHPLETRSMNSERNLAMIRGGIANTLRGILFSQRLFHLLNSVQRDEVLSAFSDNNILFSEIVTSKPMYLVFVFHLNAQITSIPQSTSSQSLVTHVSTFNPLSRMYSSIMHLATISTKFFRW